MTSKSPKDDDWFIRNAIYCWLNYFGEEHQWHAKYTELAQRETYLPKPRAAKRRKPSNKDTHRIPLDDVDNEIQSIEYVELDEAYN